MTTLVSYFTPPPHGDELPARLPDPFATQPPALIAQRAAQLLLAELDRGDPISSRIFEGARQGKMFGVLVVRSGTGDIGFLRGFSGMIGDSWDVPGFVGPLFAAGLREAVWPAGREELAAFDRQLDQLANGPDVRAAKTALVKMDAVHADAHAALAATLDKRRQQRDIQRTTQAHLTLSLRDRAVVEEALARESRADTVLHRQQRRAHRLEREPFVTLLRDHQQKQIVIRQQRAARSCELLEQLFDGYQIDNARGEQRSLRDLFAPATPPGGAGDCAGPKLFAHALREGLHPIALAEFWVGTAPSPAGRKSGIYHPSCARKCGPVLTHMLGGLPIE